MKDQCLSAVIGRFIVWLCCSIYLSIRVAAGEEGEATEYCQRETMSIRCRWRSEVIVMTSARWGRMKAGRCLNVHSNIQQMLGHDPMFLGCAQDVMSIVDGRCSGRSECEFRLQDELDSITPCYPDLARYLEASYKCVRVVQESRSCTVSVSTDEQYLISKSSSKSDTNLPSSCGSRAHPWRLEAPLGQRINISILDFTVTSRDRDLICRQYGYVLEKMNKRNVSICAAHVAYDKSQRENAVFTSDVNTLDLVLFSGTVDADDFNFLLKMTAVGCVNMIPPDNAWLKRSKDDIVIGCYLSQQTWHLTCDGNEWKGQIGTCPEAYSGTIASVQPKDDMKDGLLENVAMVIIAAAAVCLCALVVCIGCSCARRYKRRSDAKWVETPTNHKQAPLSKNNHCDGENNGFIRLPVESTGSCFVQTTS